MYQSDLQLLTEKVDNSLAWCDGFSNGSVRTSQPIEVTQALIAASWSLRAAVFALRLASKEMQERGTARPVPSNSARAGG